MKKILQYLFEHKTLPRDEARRVMLELAEGKYNDAELSSLITVYLMRTITIDELQGFRDGLLEPTGPLLGVDADTGAPTPRLAERHEESDGGRLHTFHLVSGVVFDDGEPCDAAAVVANIERWAAAPAPVSDRERNQRARAADQLDRRFQDVPVDASIRFRATRLAPDTLGSLAVGDVLRLSHPAAAPLEVTIGETTFAHATPGTRGARLAALVVGTPKENS